MKVKKYFCCICAKEYQKQNSIQKYCSPKCLKKWEEEKAKEKRKIVKEKKAISVTVLKDKLWKIVSKYIRQKYADSEGFCKCVTCDTTKHWKEQQAGHFVPSWASSFLRYTETNIHPQCFHCNINLGSNPIEYREFMIKTYGLKFVEQMLELRNELAVRKSCDYQELIEEWTEKLIKLTSK